MTERVTITVNLTREDIENGQSDVPTACPFALAIQRVLAPGYSVWIDELDIYVYKTDEAADAADVIVDLPEEAEEFIHRFDSGKDVEPLSFSINFPTAVLRA